MKKDRSDYNQAFINEEQILDTKNRTQSRIPTASNKKRTSSPAAKIKTIKKHSKVKKDLNVNDVQQRPTVGDIEWGEEKRDTEREVEDIDDDYEENDDEEELNEHDVIKEFSTLALEDVQQMSSNDQSDPIVLISSGDDYSGDIDEFFLIEAPNNLTHRHESKTITTRTTREYDQDGNEKLTILREERGSDGEIIITEEIHDSSTDPYVSRTINSDSDTVGQISPVDEHQEEYTKQTFGQNSRGLSKTLGSSSGSDVALHEPGAESSEDETGTVMVFVHFSVH